MNRLKVLPILLIFGFLTDVHSQSVMRGGDITYQPAGGNGYGFDITLYANVPVTNAVISYGTGIVDTISLSGTMLTPGIYTMTAQPSHVYPGPGSYTVTVQTGYWINFITNMPTSQNVPFIIETEINISPFIPNNYSGLFYTFQTDFIDSAGFTFHDCAFYGNDNDSLSFELTSVPGTTVPSTYLFPSDMGGSQNIDTSGLLKVFFSTYGEYAFCINVKEWRTVGPGQVIYIGKCQRVMLMSPVLISIDELALSKAVLFPNPCQHYFELPTEEKFQITIWDINGKTVLTNDRVSGRVDISELSDGVYLVALHSLTHKKTSVLRLIKQ